MCSRLGPAFLVAIAYVDPGNLDADIAAVHHSNFHLLWMLAWSSFVGGFWQLLAVYLARATGADLATLIARWYTPSAARFIWLLVETACVAVSMQELFGASIFFENVLGIPMWGGLVVASTEIFTVLALLLVPTQRVQRVFAVIVVAAACAAIILAHGSADVVSASSFVAGLVTPRIPRDQSSQLQLISLFGSMIMPHNIFLHSAVVVSRHGCNATLAELALDIALALGCALMINVAVSIAFYGTEADSIANSTLALVDRYGDAARVWWPLLLLVSSAASVGTTSMAGAYVLRLLGIPIAPDDLDSTPCWQRAVLARVVSLAPALLVALLAQDRLNVLCTLLNCIQSATLPFVLLPLCQMAWRVLSGQLRFVLVGMAALLLLFGAAVLIHGLVIFLDLYSGTPWALFGGSALAVAYAIALALVFVNGLQRIPFASRRAPTHNASSRAPLLATEDGDGAVAVIHHMATSPMVPRTARPPAASEHTQQRQGGGLLFDAALCIFAAINGFLFGYDLGVISGVLKPLADRFQLGTFAQEVVVSSLLVGALLGSPLGGWLGDRLGRRPALLIASALYCQGTLMEAFASSFAILVSGRVIVGFGVGVGSMVAPLLVSELARPRMRGALVAVNELATASGVLLAFAGVLILGDEQWRLQLGVAGVPALLQFVGCTIFPESPRFLASLGRAREAEGVILDIRQSTLWLCPRTRTRAPHSSEVVDELATLRLFDRTPATNEASTAELRAPHVLSQDAASTRSEASLEVPAALSARERAQMLSANNAALARALVIGIGLTLCQQLTGQPTLMYYAHGIFAQAGIASDKGAAMATVGLGVGKLAGTALTIARVDHWGRRRFLLAGQLGMQLGLLLLLISFALTNAGVHGVGNGALAVVGLGLFFAAYSTGYGPVTWIVLTELFPVGGRARAMGAAVAVNWLANLLVSLSFLSITEAIGTPATFGVYFAIGLLALSFCYWLVPETLLKAPDDLQNEVASRFRAIRARLCE